MMKKYKGIALSCLLAFSTVSCSDFLEFDPYGLEGSTNFWKTEEDVQKALNAFHEFTYNEGVTGRGFMWLENCSDNMVTGLRITVAIKRTHGLPCSSLMPKLMMCCVMYLICLFLRR